MSADQPQQDVQAKPRAERKTARGIVMSNKMDKTLVVQVNRKVRHPVYEKFVSKKTRLYAHDDKAEAKVGDVVYCTTSNTDDLTLTAGALNHPVGFMSAFRSATDVDVTLFTTAEFLAQATA